MGVPFIYGRHDRQFGSYGIRRLTSCKSCVVTEEKDGEYELVLKAPLRAGEYNRLINGNCVKVTTNRGPQTFRIYKVTQDIDCVLTVRARHISYDLSGDVTEGVGLIDGTPAEFIEDAMDRMIASSGVVFTVESDMIYHVPADVLGMLPTVPYSLRHLIGVLHGVCGGALTFDDTVIRMELDGGRDTGFIIRYGLNMKTFKREIGETNGYTHLLPYALSAGVPVYVSGKVVQLEGADTAVPHVLAVDLSDRFDEEEEVTPSAVAEKAEAYISEHPDLTRDAETMTVSCVNPRQDLHIYDRVRVIHGPLGVDRTMEIIRSEYDVISERLTGIVVGDRKKSLLNYMTGG